MKTLQLFIAHFSLLILSSALFSQPSLSDPDLPQLLRRSMAEKTFLHNDTAGISKVWIPKFDCEVEHHENFHICELNGDGRKDLIYHGPCRPYMESAAFIETDYGLKKVLDVAGGILEIENLGAGSNIYVYNEAIGCLLTNCLGSYHIDAAGEWTDCRSLVWLPEDQFDAQRSMPIILLRGMLRHTPFEEDIPEIDECFGDTVMGNQIGPLEYVDGLLLREEGEWQMVCVPWGLSTFRVAWIKNELKDMHPNAIVIQRFYEGFQQKKHLQMAECYHDSASFQDAVFDLKTAKEARAMWHYLLTNGKDLRIEFKDIKADDHHGTGHWEAWYTFSGTGRKVHNVIEAQFEFREGKIVRHRDSFPFWKWTRMALGATGTLLGWTPLVHNKVKATAAGGLKKFIGEHPEYQ
jgi:hypothetical protein